MPPKTKRPNANQHDRRHETGLAAPGKRISKQRSSGNLNGHPTSNGKVASSAPAPSLAEPSQPLTSSVGASRVASGVVGNGVTDGAYEQERGSASSEMSFDGFEVYNRSGSGSKADGQTMVRTDSNGVKTQVQSKANPLAVAAVVITACPLRDVIAILIILLQLPPTILAVIQFLFATLTFVPPTSLSALPSMSDMLMSTAGTPSLPTMILTDVIILILWLILWVPAQNLVLDLALAVIAISLGGAVHGKGGTTNSIVVCVAIILMSQSFRNSPFRQYGFNVLQSGLFKSNLQDDPDIPSSRWFMDTLYARPGWPRSLLGVHILTQGLVRLIRRYLSQREHQHRGQSSKKIDPEAGATTQQSRSSYAVADPSQDGAANYSTDGRSPGPSPAGRDAKEKGSGTKKKRRQIKHARIQQPLWAALASIKVTVTKELEDGEATADAIEADAVNTDNVGNANFYLDDDRIWLSGVEDTEVSFGASLARREGDHIYAERDCEPSSASGMHKSNPFYVRVNGADWRSTRFRHVGSGGSETNTDIWAGEIFGLTPLATYRCEFFRSHDESLLCTINLLTGPSPSTETASIVPSTVHQPLRPLSPTTTLKNSIAAAEQKLHDHRNRLKRNRKDHKTAVAALRRDVDSLGSRKSSTSGSEDRLRQRELQLQQHIQQAENATSALVADIEALGDVPDDEQREAAAKKAHWNSARDANAASHADLTHSKDLNARQLSAARSEVASAAQKRERLQARQAKLAEQHDRLHQAASQGADAHARRESERASRASQRAVVEQQYLTAIGAYERQARDIALKVAHGLQTTSNFDALYAQVYPHPPPALQSSGSSGSGPASPEGQLPGTGPTAFPRISASFPFSAAHFSAPYGAADGALRGSTGAGQAATSREVTRSRARSSSMHSAVSGFTDDVRSVGGGEQVDEVAAPVQGREWQRKRSDGSSIGSGSGSGSGRSGPEPVSPLNGEQGLDSRQLV